MNDEGPKLTATWYSSNPEILRDRIINLKEAYTAWLELPEGITGEGAGPVYTRWLDAYEAAYDAMPARQLQVILRECRVEAGVHF